MAEISFGGLATGLPTEDLVSSLMAIERRPLERLQSEKEYESKRLKAYSQFNDKLNDLRTAVGSMRLTGDARTTSVRLSSEEDISASSNGAATGSYEVAVAQLAQVQKTVTQGVSSKEDSIFGTGNFTIGETSITVDSSNNSLQGLMNSINAVSEETGVKASIINDGNESNNYHLVMTGDDASKSFATSYDFQDAEGQAIAFSDSTVRVARQAIAYVDGIEIVSNSNTLSGVISGVTIDLNQESEIITPAADGNPAVYQTTTLNVEADTGALKEKISTFISSYNEILNWIGSGYDETEAIVSADAGTEEDEEEVLSDILRGDATINDVKRKLQGVLTDAVGNSGSLQILSEIGIATQKNGSLQLKEGELDEVLKTKFDDVVKLLAGDGAIDGVMKKFDAYLREATSFTDGMYAEKRQRHDNAIKRLNDQIAQKEPLIDKIETRIRSQFNAMELLVSSLNAQSDYLTQQMDMLSNLSYGKK